MAPNRASHLEIPPAASSSEEEEETSSEEEETSEDEQVTAAPKPSVSSLQTKNTDRSESESESDDESSSESEPADSTVKPIDSKPMEEKKARSKPPSVVATPEKKAASKRPREAEDSKKQSKKKKSGSEAPVDDGSGAASDEDEEEEEPKKAGGGGDESKKLFQRLWSEADEIVILNGMIDYAAKRRAEPAATDMNAFHDFIKKSLHIEVTKVQLSDKVRRLKKKYSNNAARNKYTPTKPHEQQIFELSKKIWGSGGGGAVVSSSKSSGAAAAAAAAKSKGKATLASPALSKEDPKKIETDEKACVSVHWSEMIGFDMKSFLDYVLKNGLDLIPESKKPELEAKWKKLHLDEMELFLKKNQLMGEQVKLVVEKLKSSDQ